MSPILTATSTSSTGSGLHHLHTTISTGSRRHFQEYQKFQFHLLKLESRWLQSLLGLQYPAAGFKKLRGIQLNGLRLGCEYFASSALHRESRTSNKVKRSSQCILGNFWGLFTFYWRGV